jgi:hypothetical protein
MSYLKRILSPITSPFVKPSLPPRARSSVYHDARSRSSLHSDESMYYDALESLPYDVRQAIADAIQQNPVFYAKLKDVLRYVRSSPIQMGRKMYGLYGLYGSLSTIVAMSMHEDAEPGTLRVVAQNIGLSTAGQIGTFSNICHLNMHTNVNIQVGLGRINVIKCY